MRYKKISSSPVYFMMNKKGGTVCSSVSDSHATVFENFSRQQLLSPEGAKLHCVGRLDCDTEGLLFLTDDGKLSDFLTRPENKIEKEYFVRLEKAVSKNEQLEYCKKAADGLVLPAEKKAPEQKSAGAVIKFDEDQDCSSCRIILREGKFHEVKRIFMALGNSVVFLKRIRVASVWLDESLKAGEFRKLSDSEIEALKNPKKEAFLQ